MLTLVIQVVCDRVIYYTDDTTYIPPASPYTWVAHHDGDVPAGMSLRNCWSWRYQNGKFIEASEIPAEERGLSAERAALVRNAKTVRGLIAEKVTTLAKERALDLAGAQAMPLLITFAKGVIAGAPPPEAFEKLAAARAMTTLELANALISEQALREAALIDLEVKRYDLLRQVDEATTQPKLEAVRRAVALLK